MRRGYPYNARHRRERREAIAAQGGAWCNFCRRPDPHVEFAHLNHDPWDNRPGNRVLLCKPCHTKHDAPRRQAMTRRTLAKKIGQRWITREIELATVPVYRLPDKLRQIEMFEAPMKDYRTPLSHCPACRYKLDGATNITGDGPVGPGCASVCMRCRWHMDLRRESARAAHDPRGAARLATQPGVAYAGARPAGGKKG